MSGRSESPESDGADEGRAGSSDQPPARKRQRVRLSCLECRRRKLSCDRGFPCERCIKSGTPDRCSYEARNGDVVNAASGLPPPFPQLDSRRFGIGGGGVGDAGSGFSPREDHDRIRRLELEIVQLKNQLARPGAGGSYDGSTVAGTNSPSTHKDDVPGDGGGGGGCDAAAAVQECIDAGNVCGEKGELRFFRGKGFRTRYFGPHNASMAFVELTGLCPFMRETADEWLRPVILHDRKDRKRRKEEREVLFAQPDACLAALLPTREETDALVCVYLDQFEQIHRIVHMPTFRSEYADFWKAGGSRRHAAFTALVLSMMAVASCVHTHSSLKFIGMMSNARHWAERWIGACDDWLARQSQKHRKLIHFQVACLLYLGKRVNTIKKKRFWTGAGALIQDGIAVGLHREPSHMAGNISVYNQEMRRRIWTTVQEFDMQASFDHGLPTLLSQLHYDSNPPRNLDDDDFDEQTTVLPPSKPQAEYTFSSFQNLARHSLRLRLELSRLLTGPLSEIDYDQVIRYTNDLTHEIDALPSWDLDTDKAKSKKNPLIAYTLLHVQLRQYIIPLHQPYLKLRKQNSKYQYSEIIYYNAARDIVLLHDKLYEQGIRALNFLREDALTTAINLCSVTMLQPRGSTNMIMINSHHTLKLIEKCIGMKEDRLLQCGNNEPWGYSIMCAALGLLEAHLGTKTPEMAKSTSAERFVNLHYRLLSNQEPPVSSSADNPLPATPVSGAALSAPGMGPSPGLDLPDRAKSVTPFNFNPTISSVSVDPTAPGSWILSGAGAGDQAQPFNLDPSLELLGLNLNELWGESWELG
ncbi:fungal specific transcription factor [Hirsutella rhossiliensis]|uniref:Fungal specific transcription factor domain-containing protein n=1 Tax=Hirsutella rhossiliensis TaxID=111463 RepID=A0A9P8N4Z2_9HYPO|nr:fungal specific transcription factor domain-containing protein [Hirsutella rhossiliensis]KAH0966894.1 fungal specific transcription factor domain-containing protein [Hirsutella rhossiliensis]